MSAVVERKDVRLAAKQTVVRREEQLSARQARIGKGRQGRVAVENVLLIREKFTGRLVLSVWSVPVAAGSLFVDVFFLPLAGLAASVACLWNGQRQEQASASQN